VAQKQEKNSLPHKMPANRLNPRHQTLSKQLFLASAVYLGNFFEEFFSKRMF